MTMSNYQMLNNVDHYDLKVVNCLKKHPDINKGTALIFPTEFRAAHKEFPILISKNSEKNTFQAVVLVGVKPDQNLFLEFTDSGEVQWIGDYLPAVLGRGPFITGYQESTDGKIDPKVYIDISSQLLSNVSGKNIFLSHGGNSPYLENIINILDCINKGSELSDLMFKKFQSLGLLEPITINIDLMSGEKIQIINYLTINEESLYELSGKDLEDLNKKGFLESLYLIVSSLGNLSNLIRRANVKK